jgi:hypothetical protein
LRRAEGERQHGVGVGRREPKADRTELGDSSAERPHDRLDGSGERAGRAGFIVKRILRKHTDPPDKQDQRTQTAVASTESLSTVWANDV